MPAPYLASGAEASPEIQAIYKEIQATLQREKVPILFRAMSIAPAYLATTWAKYRTVLETGEVGRKDKEFIGLATAV